jgi:hypothetical protein
VAGPGDALAAVEANGTAGVAAGTVVLMRQEPGGRPAFAAAGAAGGFWAAQVLGLPNAQTLSLTDGASPGPVGGTFKLRLTQNGSPTALDTSAAVPAAATVAQVRAAVEGMAKVPFGAVAVGGADGGPWALTCRNEFAGSYALWVETDGLDYGPGAGPGAGSGAAATGPWLTRVAVTGSPAGGGTAGWYAVERSAGGAWYAARTTRTAANVTPTNPLSAALEPAAGRGPVFLEPAVTGPAGGRPAPVVNPAGLAGGTLTVLPDGVGVWLLSTATGGTFTIRHPNAAAVTLPWDATAAQVTQALDGAFAANPSLRGRYAAAGGPLPVGVRVDWADPAGDGTAGTQYYTYDHHNPPTAWAGGQRGTAAVQFQGAAFNAVREVRTYSPGGVYPAGGTFTLTLGDQTTGEVAFDATFQDVQDAVERLRGYAGNVTAGGGPLPDAPVRLEFTGALAGAAVPDLAVGASALTPAGAAAAAFTPAARTIRTRGPTGPTAAEATRFTLAAGGVTSAPLDPKSLTPAALAAASAGVDRNFLAAQGVAGGPWRFVYKGRLSQAPPPAYTFAVAAPGRYAVEAADGPAAGGTTPPDGGAVRLAFGPQYRLSLTGAAGDTVALAVNGAPTAAVAFGTAAREVAAAVQAAAGAFGSPGVGGSGGPLGTAPVYLTFLNWPCERELAVTLGAASAAARVGVTPRMSISTRPPVGGVSLTYEVAAHPRPGGGTWAFRGGVNDLGFSYPDSAPLAWDADAAAVQAAVEARTFTHLSSGLVFTPYAGLVAATGGPLPARPVVLTVATAPDSPLRDYGFAPGLGLGVDARLLTPESGPGVAATLDWLGTADLSPGATAADAQAALRATPNGAGLTVTPDAAGRWVVAAPGWAGGLGAEYDRLAAFGWLDGGRLAAWYNSVPRDGFLTAAGTTSRTLAYSGEANHDPYDLTYSGGNNAVSGLALSTLLAQTAFPTRADEPVALGAGGGLWGVLGPTAVAPFTSTYAPGQAWWEVRPPAGRTPRTSADGWFTHAGAGTSAGLITGSGTLPGTEPAYPAQADLAVPAGTELWLTPRQGLWQYEWHTPTPAARHGVRLAASTYDPTYLSYAGGVPAYLVTPGVAPGDFLLEPDPADWTVNAGLVASTPWGTSPAAVPAHASWAGVVPTATPQPQPNSAGLPATRWDRPLDGLAPARGDSLQGAVVPVTPAPPGATGHTDAWLGRGAKALAGALYVRQGTLPADLLTAGLGFGGPVATPGRSLAFTLQRSGLPATVAGGATVTVGGFGSIGPVVVGGGGGDFDSRTDYVQGLCDAAFGAGAVFVSRATLAGLVVGFAFDFRPGPYAQRAAGAVTVDDPGYQVVVTTAGSDPPDLSLGVTHAAAGAAETSAGLAAGGGLTLHAQFGVGAAGPPAVPAPYTYALREGGLLAEGGPAAAQATGGLAYPGSLYRAVLQSIATTGTLPLGGFGGLTAGDYLTLDGTPMESAAGRGVGVLVTGSFAAGVEYAGGGGGQPEPYSPLPGDAYGLFLAFVGGLCVGAKGSTDRGDETGRSGTFLTADGKTVTLLHGYVMSAA